MRGIGIGLLWLVAGMATASTSVSDLLLAEKYQYSPPSFDICTGNKNACKEVSRHDEFILVHADGGASCPAGYYFLLDSKQEEIVPVDTVTCDPTLRASLALDKRTKQRLLVIEQHGKISGSVSLDQH